MVDRSHMTKKILQAYHNSRVTGHIQPAESNPRQYQSCLTRRHKRRAMETNPTSTWQSSTSSVKKKTAHLKKTHLGFVQLFEKVWILHNLHYIKLPPLKRTNMTSLRTNPSIFYLGNSIDPKWFVWFQPSHVFHRKLSDRRLRPLHLVNLRPSKLDRFDGQQQGMKNLFQPFPLQEEKNGSNMIQNHHLDHPIIPKSPKDVFPTTTNKLSANKKTLVFSIGFFPSVVFGAIFGHPHGVDPPRLP